MRALIRQPALGLVGLVIAVPVVTLSLPAGHLADRFSRKRIILVSQIFSALTSIALALGFLETSRLFLLLRHCAEVIASWRLSPVFLKRHHPIFHFDDASIPLIYLLLFLGSGGAHIQLGGTQFIFSYADFSRCLCERGHWNNSVFQIGSVVGPALSGLLVAYIGFPFVYLAGCAVRLLLFPFDSSDSAQQTEARPERGKHVEKSHGRTSFVFRRK
jgi:MFS family permease